MRAWATNIDCVLLCLGLQIAAVSQDAGLLTVRSLMACWAFHELAHSPAKCKAGCSAAKRRCQAHSTADQRLTSCTTTASALCTSGSRSRSLPRRYTCSCSSPASWQTVSAALTSAWDFMSHTVHLWLGVWCSRVLHSSGTAPADHRPLTLQPSDLA